MSQLLHGVYLHLIKALILYVKFKFNWLVLFDFSPKRSGNPNLGQSVRRISTVSDYLRLKNENS